jgi:hypothetical protein
LITLKSTFALVEVVAVHPISEGRNTCPKVDPMEEMVVVEVIFI